VRKMRRLYRIGATAGAILLPIGVVMATGTTEASAATPYQYCDYLNYPPRACLNAWSGGPNVNVETSDNPNIQNNRFEVLPAGSGYVQIQFVGGGSQYNGYCIGDLGNNQDNATAGLVPCHDHSGNAGWGTLFTNGHSCGSDTFHNAHWNGYLGPVDGYVNGSHFYLNKPTTICFSSEPTN
jgi:hypothetical protein